MSVRLEAGAGHRGDAIGRRPRGRFGIDRAALRGLLAREEGRLLQWWPVGLATGIAVYFALSFEPDWRIASVVAVASAGFVAAAWRGRSWTLAAALGGCAIAAGFAAASVRSEWVRAPVIAERTAPAIVEGRVREVAARGDGRVALRISPVRIGNLPSSALPANVRVTLPADRAVGIEAGDEVKLRAILLPPPGPVAPGAYDFARDAWFDRLGAVGFALSRADRLPGAAPGALIRVGDALERLRARIAARVRAAVPGDRGAIAAALLTGKRGAISEATLAHIRDSGLAHLLAISGLHMALVCGAVFGAVAMSLAAFSWLALRITAKKWAAAAALAAGFGYYLLAGGSVATERAFIMAAISLAAVILDRPVITMRNVAIAATATLAMRPESLLQAGFQMSFGAVIALVAFYEALRRVRERAPEGLATPRSPAAVIGFGVAAIAATTIVATLATGPIAAYHFNRVAVYGLIANLAAVPLAGFVVMPLGLLALAAMPFGLEAIPLQLMAAAIGYIIDVSELVAGWDGAVRLVPAAPPVALMLFAAGGLWICLWRRAIRWLGIAPIAAAVIAAATIRPPDLLVAREAANVAVRDAEGHLAVARSRAASYSVEQWLRRDGDGRGPAEAAGGAFTCDFAACAAKAGAGPEVAFILRRDVLTEECWRADIIVSTIPVVRRCAAATVIDLTDVRRKGPYAVYIDADAGVTLVDTASLRGARPWSAGHVGRTR